MSDEPIDFTLLHPPAGALSATIAARCTPLLAARREHATTVQLARWWWPTLAASALLAVASALLLALPVHEAIKATSSSVAAVRPPAPRIQLAEAVGIPQALARHLTRAVPPSLSDLLETHR